MEGSCLNLWGPESHGLGRHPPLELIASVKLEWDPQLPGCGYRQFLVPSRRKHVVHPNFVLVL